MAAFLFFENKIKFFLTKRKYVCIIFEDLKQRNQIHKKYRGIAQLVEQWSPKPRAVGSNPTAPAKKSPTIFSR